MAKVSQFDVQEEAGDQWVADLRRTYGIAERASLADIEKVAKQLLANPYQQVDAVQLVLNRSVDTNEEVLYLLDFRYPDKAFGMLIMERATENARKRKAFKEESMELLSMFVEDNASALRSVQLGECNVAIYPMGMVHWYHAVCSDRFVRDEVQEKFGDNSLPHASCIWMLIVNLTKREIAEVLEIKLPQE